MMAKDRENRTQLVRCVVVEPQVGIEARPEARVTRKEPLHPICVTRRDDGEIFSMIFHELQQRFHRLGAEVLAILSAECICFVDEQDASECLVDDLLNLYGS